MIRHLRATVSAMALGGALVAGLGAAEAANPCGMTNPCAAHNPCGMANPCGGMNPCAASGNKTIRRDHVTDKKALLKRGKALWESEKLGKSGLSCMTCHDEYEKLNLDDKTPWPRNVSMTGDIVTLDQMINYCVINPIAGEPLDPNSVDMTAMNAWYHEYVKGYKAK